MGRMDWFILAAWGLATFLSLLGVYEVWRLYWSPRQRRLDQRIQQMLVHGPQEGSTAIVQQRFLSRSGRIDRWLARVPGLQALDRFLSQADWPFDVSQTMLLGALLLSLSALLGAVLGFHVLLIAMLMLLVLLGAIQYIRYRIGQRIKAMEHQLPDALDLMARALQSGHAFVSALQITASESRPPMAVELRKVFDEINLGMSVQLAMGHLASRIQSKEIGHFVVAVLIQNETGGNLADVLRKTATLIRERQKMAGVVRVLSAEGRISAWILSVMPFLLAFALYLINPEFISVLWKEQIGRVMLGISSGLMLAGVFWMSRLVQIKV